MSAGGLSFLSAIVLMVAGFAFAAAYCGESVTLGALIIALIVGGGLTGGSVVYAWSSARCVVRVGLALGTAVLAVAFVGYAALVANIEHCGLF